MKILIVTDAWEPQVNGVVRTLKSTRRELELMGHTVEMLTPLSFKTVPCPTYPDIRLSLFPGQKTRQIIRDFNPDAIHIATEGPLGLTARAYAKTHGLNFTTAYHTRFPEYVKARTGIPLSWTYTFLRWFHRPSKAVMAPTRVVIEDLEKYQFQNVVLWERGVDLEVFKCQRLNKLDTAPPIFLYVGRVAVEKNLEAFLQLDLPGSKWVAGAGPDLERLKKDYPEVNYLGVLNQAELAEVYASSDVFVFPSKTDTFGLVLLEAMACGCPVAAYPVTGPLDVVGDSDAGVLHHDLQQAALEALNIPRTKARIHAEKFSWARATEQFVEHLHPFHEAEEMTLGNSLAEVSSHA
jgi:glycosyltransferase involved in cell wall biosynthesis